MTVQAAKTDNRHKIPQRPDKFDEAAWNKEKGIGYGKRMATEDEAKELHSRREYEKTKKDVPFEKFHSELWSHQPKSKFDK